jgi:hypothetical protein
LQLALELLDLLVRGILGSYGRELRFWAKLGGQERQCPA